MKLRTDLTVKFYPHVIRSMIQYAMICMQLEYLEQGDQDISMEVGSLIDPKNPTQTSPIKGSFVDLIWTSTHRLAFIWILVDGEAPLTAGFDLMHGKDQLLGIWERNEEEELDQATLLTTLGYQVP